MLINIVLELVVMQQVRVLLARGVLIKPSVRVDKENFQSVYY